MFGSFGCCDNFRDCHHRERECDHRDHREKEREVKPQQPAVCNVLASISVGTELSLLSIKGIGSFNDVIFEGFANGVALFSALARNNNDKDNKDDNKDDKHRQRNTFNGILRVCPTDIVAIAI
ncbi:DUF3915 domain-containing protein [Bacillus thuringiensis]|uniref:DUF3915 domain-containing protein n=4 Tax=Bacillus cereus group TaxID=86661 RepID=A0A9X6VER8_BACTU|nr:MULTISPECIES: DUF3915 domain-containing protein [Bacillus]EEM40015.1 hypothetical protein bthur0004_38840 [Bacillus thuringiensis serovar sotto str. T04001]AFQ19232.1 hypothetical protein BTG_29185 [Bacillus thuringiensis HD-771]AJQ60770.1 hypothetical protein SD98_21520 [Bacillus thuringiensis serovar morrisoni]AMR86479.1 hypothetical protein A3L20_21370 [Bacillus thuringiensis]AND09374.1 hypothetical protein Bt4C1_19845 [Bacillus thuringiensis serovar alesti]